MPELTAITYLDFTKDATDFSKAWTCLPPWLADEVKSPFLSIEATAEISSLPNTGVLSTIFNSNSVYNQEWLCIIIYIFIFQNFENAL